MAVNHLPFPTCPFFAKGFLFWRLNEIDKGNRSKRVAYRLL